jgi:putative adenylate-forming enzyme
MRFKLNILINLIQLKWQHIRYANNLKLLQQKKWKALQKYLVKSPFYAPFIKENRVYQDFPLMDKKGFMADFNTINTCQITLEQAQKTALEAEHSRNFNSTIEGITVGLSTGTSGNRGVFLASENERAQWVSAVLDRVIGFKLRKRSVAFFLRANSNLYRSVQSRLLQFEFFDLLQPTEEHIQKLNALKPTILVAQPSCLLELAEYIRQGKLNILPEKIISVAEVLYPEDKKLLEQTFGQTIHQVYQCTEGFLASTCSQGNLHFHEDFLIIEKKYLDADRTRFHPVITDLLRRTQPVIRYELNDIIHELTNCPCGSQRMGIAQIEGRSDDILRFLTAQNQTISIYPDFFRRAIVLSDERIQDYLLIQRNPKQLILYVGGTPEMYIKASVGIRRLLHEYGCNDIEIIPLPNPGLERGSKLRRIRNEST